MTRPRSTVDGPRLLIDPHDIAAQVTSIRAPRHPSGQQGATTRQLVQRGDERQPAVGPKAAGERPPLATLRGCVNTSAISWVSVYSVTSVILPSFTTSTQQQRFGYGTPPW